MALIESALLVRMETKCQPICQRYVDELKFLKTKSNLATFAIGSPDQKTKEN